MAKQAPLAMVTGAGIRVGRAIALELGRIGFDIILHGNQSRKGLDQVASKLGKLGRQVTIELADFSKPSQVDDLAVRVRALERSLDVLVNNAAIFERVPFSELTRDQYQQMMAINLDAPFFLTQGLLPCLEAANSPVVINIGDIIGERPINRYAHYSVSKAGILMMTRALALELGPKIRVNAVSPGAVAFPDYFDEAAKRADLARVPLKREGTVEDIANAVCYLVKAQYVTGEILAVDGGRKCRL